MGVSGKAALTKAVRLRISVWDLFDPLLRVLA
jgi:hypothetical protein